CREFFDAPCRPSPCEALRIARAKPPVIGPQVPGGGTSNGRGDVPRVRASSGFGGGWGHEPRGKFFFFGPADLSGYFLWFHRGPRLRARPVARPPGTVVSARRRRQRGELQPRRQRLSQALRDRDL